jgi:hypothetical protein
MQHEHQAAKAKGPQSSSGSVSLACPLFAVPFFAAASAEQQQAAVVSSRRLVGDHQRRSVRRGRGLREAALVCSLAETCQRAGPASRETPGKCWRLHQEPAYEQRPMAAMHEIRRFNLAEVVLQPLVAGLPQSHALAAALAPSSCGPLR